jgi:hypothetical protein
MNTAIATVIDPFYFFRRARVNRMVLSMPSSTVPFALARAAMINAYRGITLMIYFYCISVIYQLNSRKIYHKETGNGINTYYTIGYFRPYGTASDDKLSNQTILYYRDRMVL